MNNVLSIYKREIKSYFTTPLAYVYIVIFLILSSYVTFSKNNFFERRTCSLDAFFQDMPLLLILLVPAVAMRLWAEERETGSIELLFSLPVTAIQAVLGKFFAAWSVLGISLVLTFPMVITVALLGNPDEGPIMVGYLGTFLMAGAYLAIGSFCSMLSKSQVIAFVMGVAFCLAFYIPGNPSVMNFFSGFLPDGLVKQGEMLSSVSRFDSLRRGVLDLRDAFFFIFLAAGWLWANVILLEERRAA